ncbi:MAG: cytochrome c [Flavobacteriales bacterium]|nr:cytochrome c [Flavobacteriales bacterium]
MRPELNLIEEIESYISGEMLANDRVAFEDRMKSDPELQEEVSFQQDILEGIDDLVLKQSVQSAYKQYQFNNILKWGFGSIVAVAAIVVTSLMIFDSEHNQSILLPTDNKEEVILADADKYIPSQIFELTTEQGTVIETEGGMIIAIPKDAFLDENGEIYTGSYELEVKEALEPVDVIQAGLSPTSNENMSETAGIFFMNATVNGIGLQLNPEAEIIVEMPIDEPGQGAEILSGRQMIDGTIVWENPYPVSDYLTPVDIKALNFYPPNFKDSLYAWGLNADDKAFTDSLFYTFSYVVEEDKGINAARLFKQNCSTCHTSGSEDLIGPGLGGIIHKRNLNWLVAFTKNSQELIRTGDKQAIEIYNIFDKSVMPPQDLSRSEIVAIFDYLDWETRVKIDGDDAPMNSNGIVADEVSNQKPLGIDPAQIKAIWNEKFQNTIIATKEFEERLQVIYASCDEEILDLYINNLNLPIYLIDSMAMRASSSHKMEFFDLYLRKEGSLKVENPLGKKLNKYYQEKSKIYAQAIAETDKKFWLTKDRLDEIASNKTFDKLSDDEFRKTENYLKELNINIESAYQQLGKKAPKIKSRYHFKSKVNVLGWSNINRSVIKATSEGTSFDYTDEEGKNTTTNYKNLEIKINDLNLYDRAYVYLAARDQNSYARMKFSKNRFSKPLNELLDYNVICIGYKGEEAFSSSIESVEPGENWVDLEPILDNDLEVKIRKLCTNRAGRDMRADMAFEKFQIKEQARKKRNEHIVDLRGKLHPLIFPCMPPPEPSPALIN